MTLGMIISLMYSVSTMTYVRSAATVIGGRLAGP